MLPQREHAPVYTLDFSFIRVFELISWADLVAVPHQTPWLQKAGGCGFHGPFHHFAKWWASLCRPGKHCCWVQDRNGNLHTSFCNTSEVAQDLAISSFAAPSLLIPGSLQRSATRSRGQLGQLICCRTWLRARWDTYDFLPRQASEQLPLAAMDSLLWRALGPAERLNT